MGCIFFLCHWLLCLGFLKNWCNFNACFILFYCLLGAGESFFRSTISHLVRFRLFPVDLCLACRLAFDWCVCCSFCCPFWLCENFTFWIIPFRVNYIGCHLGLCRASWPIDSRQNFHGLGTLKFQYCCIFLYNKTFFFDVTLNPLVNLRVRLKIFTLKSGRYAVLLHVTE